MTEPSSPNQGVRDAVKARVRAQFEPRAYPFPVFGELPPIVMVRLLSDDEIDNARIEAARYVTKRKIDLNIDPECFDREVQRQLVWRAVVLPEVELGEERRRPLFPSDDDVRRLPSTVIEALHRLYLDHQDAIAPLERLDDAKLDALVATAEKGGALALSILDHPSVVRVALALAQRLAKS